MDRHTANLVRGRYSSTNRYKPGPSHGVHLPLLLDDVLQDRPRVSRSKLLQLPAVLLAGIFQHLADDVPALASLALVNSDCRWIARSYQFAEVYLDYSPRAQQLMAALVQHMDRNSRQPSIGACVRRLVFASSADWVAHTLPALFDATRNSFNLGYPQTVQRQLIQRVADEYVKVRATALIAIALAMPNLRRLIWTDTFPLDEFFFYSVSRSSVRELELEKVLIEPTWRMEPPWIPESWPLTSLSIDNALYMEPGEIGMYGQLLPREPIECEFFDTLLHRCAPTLESLRWTYVQYNPMYWCPSTRFRDHPVSFPRLRSLRLYFDQPQVPCLSSLLAAPLRHLELSTPIWRQFSATISASRSLQDLETFVMDAVPEEAESFTRICKLISQQTKLQKLLLHENPNNYPDLTPVAQHVIPALASGTFDNLRSLALAWGGHGILHSDFRKYPFIPKNALEAIGSIHSLEQLSLSLVAARRTLLWRINHDRVRTCLQGLKRLKLLALWRDTYQNPMLQVHPDSYYRSRYLTAEERADAESRGEFISDGTPKGRRDREAQIWERLHCDRMLAHAARYADVLPALEWMLCGERPIGFERNAESAPEAVALTANRNIPRVFLQETFGLGSNHGLWEHPKITT